MGAALQLQLKWTDSHDVWIYITLIAMTILQKKFWIESKSILKEPSTQLQP